MCFSSKVSKILDPGGFIAEKTLPKKLAPFAGLHGTSQAMRQPDDAAPSKASKLLGE